MATRLYYRAGDLPNLTPAFSASGWIRTADAVRRWKYRPARTASGPVASRKSVRIRFALKAQ